MRISEIVLGIKKFIIAGCISLILWLEDEPKVINRNVLAANTNQHPSV